MNVALVVVLALPSLALAFLFFGAVIGALFPREHVFTRTLAIARTPVEVWRLVSDFEAQPSWNPSVELAERLPDKAGRPVWCEQQGHGPPVVLVTEVAEAPRRLVRAIDDPRGSFSGSWTYEIEPAGRGARVRLTERGSVPNTFFRFMVRVVGPGHYIERTLRAVAARLGDPAATIS